MSDRADVSPSPRWRRRFWALAAAVLAVQFLLSWPVARGWLIGPLCQHDGKARGEIAYVMADGPANWERLHAASDLYHMRRVGAIFVRDERDPSMYNFVRKQNDTRVQRAIDYLGFCGVPADAIHAVPIVESSWLSSRDEASCLAQMLPHLESVVIVTSPPHTRRSKLAFRRVFNDSVSISVYSACAPSQSVESHSPIWIEYTKLIVYWLFA